MVTEAVLLLEVPSFTRYVKLSIPDRFAPGVYRNEPFAFSVNVPLDGAVTRIAVSELPSGSLSFDRTPGAGMFSAESSFAMYASFAATGASGTAAMLMVTVAAPDRAVPSLARYVNESIP